MRFLQLLRAHGVSLLVDVRRHPGSRRHPHFARAALQESLADAQVQYVWEEDLGGRRRARPDSPNTAWREDAFRGYADYTATEPFQAALARVIAMAAGRHLALMCAERLPWQCHRNLIADALTVRGWDVLHIMDETKSMVHRVNPAARLVENVLIYDGFAQGDLL